MKQKQIIYIGLIFSLSVFLFLHTRAQDTIDIYQYDLNDLLKVKVVSEFKSEENLNDALMSIQVITQKEIQEKAYFTLEEALADLPGFQFRNIQGFNTYSFVRGFPNQNNTVLVLVDGVKINELNSGGFYGGGQYNLSNVEQIEVVYGPASVTYGTNAISGVINIITKDSKKQEGFSVNALAGTLNTYSTDISYSHNNEAKTFGYHVSGMIKSTDKIDLSGEAGDFQWTETMDNFERDYALDAKMYFKNFTAGINYQNKQSSRASKTISNQTIYKDYGSLWNINFLNNYLKHEYSLGKNISISSLVYYRYTNVLSNSIYMVTDTTQRGYYRPNDAYGLETIWTYHYKEQLKIFGGVSWEHENLAETSSRTYSSSGELRPPIPAKPKMNPNDLLSGFLQTRYQFSFPIEIFAGFRYDYSTVYDEVITPKGGIVFTKNSLKLKAIYSEAFRAPKPWDYTSGLGNPNLLPEEMKSVELSAEYLIKKQIRLEMHAYKNELSNAFIKTVVNNSFRWTNLGKIYTDGMEILIKYKRKNLSLYSNYTYNYSIDEHSDIVPEIAKHTANFGASYAIGKYYHFNIQANYIGSRKNPQIIPTTNTDQIDPALVFHFVASVIDYKNANIQLIVNNLFNAQYYHTSNLTPARYKQADTQFMLKLGYSINSIHSSKPRK